MATTKAAKSITINSTKYELANALDYQHGKVQLKAKDVLLSETEVGDGKYIAINLKRDPDRDVGETRRGYLISSIETSENIDPATYTGQEMANDFLAGGLKITAFVPSNGWSDNSLIEISELNVFDNSEGEPNYYYTFLGAGLSTAVGNDTVKYKLSIDGLSTADTLDHLTNGYRHAALYNCLDAWTTPTPPPFIIDLANGQEMFDFTNTTWNCTAFDSGELKSAIATGRRIVIRSRNYLDHDNPTTNKLFLECVQATDSDSGHQIMLMFFDGLQYYHVLTAYTGTITSLNVYHNSISA